MNKQHIQRSLEWYRDRLGYFTGSQVGLLMKGSRSKDNEFGDTAMSYIMQKAGERLLRPNLVEDDDKFEEYLREVSVETKAMRLGTEREGNARYIYEKLTHRHLIEVGSCKSKDIEYFASSPDGFYCSDDGEKGCIEIKCPNVATYMSYLSNIKGTQSLKEIKPEYYWQCQSHMLCTGAEWCDFVFYNPYLIKTIRWARIKPDTMAFETIKNKVAKANELVNKIIA
jgi:hypothetical protein